MQDTGQHMEAGRLLHELVQRESQIYQLQAQLRHFHSWTACLASTALQPLSMPVMLAAIQVLVSGFPEGTTERELALFFNDLLAANRAAVAPGPAVSDCKLLRGSKGVALVELRCSVEASNCMAFDGVQFKTAQLNVQRPRDYRPDAAILLGPCQPDPAVVAAVSNTAQQQHHRSPPPAAVAGDQGQCSSYPPASAAAHWAPGYVNNHHSSNSNSFSSHPARYGAATGGDIPAYSNASRMQAIPAAAAAAQGEAVYAGPGESSSSRSTAAQDLAPSGDQGKRDEVFIGGLPSHWKAQQVKELLAPYGQLKSLSVAMDATTGKNKGYAFVVFADTLVVPRAIEELDCKVVEGKILAVQRATEGKASACAASLGKDITSSSAHHLSLVASSNSNISSSRCTHRGPASNPMQHKQLQHLQQQQRHHRISSGSSSGSSSAAGYPPAAAPAAVSGGCGSYAPGQPSSIHPPMQQQQQLPYPATAAAAVSPPAAAAAAQQLPGPAAPRPATAPLPPGDGAALGQRLLAAVTAGAAASAAAAGGPACARQYDVNELYIGDLPLSWDEDAVRRMLGRYGKIKYFTLRNGRDKNFAFCKFKDSSVVDAAIQGLHGKIVDGYFLNVRRAIEGKQQQQQQRQWQGRQGMSGPMGGSMGGTPPPAAAAAMPGRMMGGASRFGQLQACPQQQQQQHPKRQVTAGALSAAIAEVDIHGPAENHHQQQQQQEEEEEKVSGTVDTCVTGAGAKQQQQQQQRESTSTSSTAPSPPRTPTAADLQQQQLLPQQQGASQQQQQAAASATKEQNTPALPPIPQQQQQQQGSLFLNSSGPASWGAPGLFTSAYQQQQHQSQQQNSSLLQTWDMLSPWSLFSGSTAKVQW